MSKKYLLGMYEKAVPAELTWIERLEAARECGFDYVEISVDESDARLSRLEWTPAERRQLVRNMETTGTLIRSLCLSAHRKYPLGASDPETVRRSLDIMKKALDLACDLGVRTIQLAGYDVYYEQGSDETRKRFEENLAKAVEMASRAGVLLGFETMETPFMDTVEKAMAYVSKIDSPYLGVYPDMGNLTNASFLYGKSVADDIVTGRGHIVAAHCKETVAGRYREVPFGTGTTDYAGALDELVSQGVRRYVAEMWYVGSGAWREELSAASTFVRGKIDAAFERAGL
ncbi:L-ribulose-5-phosphate 3-epimerase [Olsenella sp. An293]|uniref:L-ribulose-5-phosphate 3-epimerase n=1 Tax=Olsenella sp. An293 TaxID=1965626 RepID=UPI000B37F881|nr:L-ribulose-5-phosphate 3-epimerase [Olsenella sp. An293]OUO33588.1 L-ribulose-5-phosphate 4-epimerase [Olsenella sp. An293]